MYMDRSEIGRLLQALHDVYLDCGIHRKLGAGEGIEVQRPRA